jgi:60 kDa SS-A/Ro ribonucleoprotein
MTYNYALAAEPNQREKASSDQVKNNAGGYVYQIDKWARLQRFLVLGSESSTYYQKSRELTLENARCIEECIREDVGKVLNTLLVQRTLPKHDTALFVLAVVAKDHAGDICLETFSQIVRTGTHLFQFLSMVTKLRGWGRSLKRLVKGWYTGKDLKALEYQCAKYQNREGWTHRDVLRCCHLYAPEAPEEIRPLIRNLRKPDDYSELTTLFSVIKKLPNLKSKEIIGLIHEYNLTHEMIPSEKRTPEVWAALAERMPLGALVRNLGNLSNKGVIGPGKWEENEKLCERLTDQEYIHKSRLHPFSVLLASSVYNEGHGLRGSLTWDREPSIAAALNKTFHKAFDNIEPTGKRHMLAIDVSSSMWWSPIAGTHLQAGDAAAAMSLVTNRTEKRTLTYAFADRGLKALNVERTTSLSGMNKALKGHCFGGTNCALPMMCAAQAKWPIDAFIVYTDNETWAGSVHPAKALKDYRRKMNIDAKLIVVAFTATNFSIADPKDPGMLDVVGFDASAPKVMTDFIRG